MPPWGFWPLAIIGVMLFEISLGGLADRPRTPGPRLAVRRRLDVPRNGLDGPAHPPGYVVAGLRTAGYHAVAASSPRRAWRVIGRPAAHTLAEALRFSFPFGGVPLATMGISQVSGPLVGPARSAARS